MKATEELHIFLVNLPYLFGFFGGIVPADRRRLSSILMIAGVASIAGFVLDGPAVVTEGRQLPLIGTGVLWISIGVFTGLQVRLFTAWFGPLGYLYTLAIALVGVGFGEALTQGLIPLLRGEQLDNAATTALSAYCAMLLIGVILLASLGRGLRSALRRVVAIFSIVGLVELALDQLWGTFLYSVIWFVPGIDPPDTLQIELALVLAVLAALYVGDPQPEGARSLDPIAGLMAARLKEEGIGSAPSLTSVPFTYDVPSGWLLEGVQPSDTQYTVALRPEGTTGALQSRLLLALVGRAPPRLVLSVLEYTREDVADEALLRRNAEINLAARHARVLDDWVGSRHGAASYECICRELTGYVYVVTFVVGHSELVCQWRCSRPEMFRWYLPEVNDFIDSLDFTSEGGGLV